MNIAASAAWLPEGRHHGLHITHVPTGRGGLYTGGGWKGIIHTTEGDGFEAMERILVGERAEPHLLLARKPDGWHVAQFIPFDLASRALEHPAGTPDTNNAHAVQIEVAGFAVGHLRNVGGRVVGHDWPTETYTALSILALMIEHRVPIPRRRAARFADTPHRLGGSEFIHTAGWLGHEHVPNQPSGHWDPGAIRGGRLIRLMDEHAHEVIPQRKAA
jgi:hypothetical protein